MGTKEEGRRRFGAAIKEARKAIKDEDGDSLTQEGLAELVGNKLNLPSVSFGSISNWESGKNVPKREIVLGVVTVLTQQGGLKSINDANQLITYAGYSALDPHEQREIFGESTQSAENFISTVSGQADTPAVASSPFPFEGTARRKGWRSLWVLFLTGLLVSGITGVLFWWLQVSPAGTSANLTPADTSANSTGPIVDRPGGQLSLVQFEYIPAGQVLELYLCVEAKHYRLKTEELHPKPQVLLDKAYDVTDRCGKKRPVINMNVGDIEEVSIGVSDDVQNFPVLRVYRITRTTDGIEGGFVREDQAQEILRTPTPP